jgi:hypothetical protein
LADRWAVGLAHLDANVEERVGDRVSNSSERAPG